MPEAKDMQCESIELNVILSGFKKQTEINIL